MKLSQFKQHLSGMERIAFELPSGDLVPSHFHVTEVGQIDKKFIDCGGTLREEKVISFQLWEADDYDHRLHPEKLVNIIELSEEKLGLGDFDIEVEYQGPTIGKYGLDLKGNNFTLTTKMTDCLAKDNCGVPEPSCAPGSGCC